MSLVSGQTLRILLISPREELRNEVKRALASQVGDYRVHWVSQADLALSRAQDLLPQVIMVDDEQGTISAIVLIKQLFARSPGTPILALVAPDAVARASQAVLAGARAFLLKPLNSDELVATLKQLITETPVGPPLTVANANGHVIAFCAPKGGTGRTMTCINTAVSLRAMVKRPVVMVDADYAAPALDVALNLANEHDITDLLPRLSHLDVEFLSGVLASHVSGLSVLLAPPPAGLDHPISLPQVQQILVLLKRMFPWVFVDLGLPMDETAFAFLDAADRIVMTVLPEMVGLRNTRLMIDQLYGRGYPEDKVWLVLNRATIRGGISAHDIEERLHIRVRHAIPDDQPLVTLSVNRGVPLVLSHGNSAMARALRRLAGMLLADQELGSQPETGDVEAEGGVWRRLLRPLRREPSSPVLGRI